MALSKPDGTLEGDCLALLAARLRVGDAQGLTRIFSRADRDDLDRLVAKAQRLVAIVEWFAAYEAEHDGTQRHALARALWQACWPPRPPGRLVEYPAPAGRPRDLRLITAQQRPQRGRPRLQLAARWRRVLDDHGVGDAIHRQKKAGADQGSVLLRLFELQTRGPGRPRQAKSATP